jgi:hypothetical protein
MARSIVRRSRVSHRTLSLSDRTPLWPSPINIQKGSRDGFERPDTSGHPWSDSSARPVTQRPWFSNRPLPLTGRVQSVRKMLSWHLTVGIDCGEYKYIPYPSIWGLLLICSAEKHLSYAMKCKRSPSPRWLGGDWELGDHPASLWMTQLILWAVVGDSPRRSVKELACREHLILIRIKGSYTLTRVLQRGLVGSGDSPIPRENIVVFLTLYIQAI